MHTFNAFDKALMREPEFDPHLKHLISQWSDPPTALEVFRVWDEITLMRADEAIAPYRLVEKIERILEESLTRDGTTYKELANKALWRDQDF